MKKLFISILIILLFPAVAFAASVCTQAPGRVDSHMRTLTFTCTGDSGDGSILDTTTNTDNTTWIKGWYLYKVAVDPGSPAPDAASLFVLDAGGLDLLGSEDGGTTAYKGLNLIHASLKRSTMGDIYTPRAGVHQPFFHPITGALTIDVDDQGTASAVYVITLTFVK